MRTSSITALAHMESTICLHVRKPVGLVVIVKSHEMLILIVGAERMTLPVMSLPNPSL